MKQSQTLEICILWDDNPSLIRPPRLSYALIIAGKRLRVTAFRADCSPHNSRISSWKTLFSFSIPRCCGRISPQVRLGRDRGQLGHHPPKNGTRRAAARSKERKKKVQRRAVSMLVATPMDVAHLSTRPLVLPTSGKTPNSLTAY